MRKIIRIFLASSIVEFANERMAIENFIRNISDKFEENYDVKIQPLLCENFDDAYSKIRKQEEYNEKIRNSDLCFFIFFTKAGEYTREEFEVARKKFEETGKPKIYTYFKVIKDETAEQSLYDFMDELDKIFGHYYGTFEHIDTVKLRILLNLKLQEMDFLEIKVDGDACVVDGKKTLSLENVSEFANNSIFQELKAELYEVEGRYFNLKAKYETDECSQSEKREYIEIASKRQNLIDAIEEIQKNIFNMSLRMCQDEARGEITLRQKEAYRFFESGDLEGANNILDFAEIENDYLRDIAIMEANIRKRSEIFIRETKTKIDIIKAMTKLPTRFTEIEELYDKILPVVFKFKIEFDTVFDFIRFLYLQNKHQKAYEIGNQLEACFFENNDEKTAEVYHLLETICSDMVSKKSEAEIYCNKAIKIRAKLAGTNPERFNSDLADSYNNAGVFYKNQGQPEKAEDYYNKAIEIKEKLADANPERFNPDLAMSYNNAGNFYYDHGQPEKAEGYYNKAIEIREKLAETNPGRFIPDLAMSYNNAGIFYDYQEQPGKAEDYYNKAIEIRGKLAETNPERFNSDLADSYNNVGIFYDDQGQLEKAEDYYNKAIKTREKLAETNPERFDPDLAVSYYNSGNFYYDHGQPEKAEDYYNKAIEIYKKLAETNPERFNPDLADSYNNAGNFYKNQGQPKKAEDYYNKAVEIREKLAETNPERFNPDLTDSYNNAGIFYYDQGQPEKAEGYYNKAIKIKEKLAETNPERFNPDLSDSYNNVGFFYKNQGQPEKAEDYYNKAIEIYKKLAETNPERFIPNLAVNYFNYAIFTQNDNFFKKALQLAKIMPGNKYCKQIINALEGE